MATSIITDCSSIQGSTTSSSSDILTVTTAASSWCAIPTCTRIRIVRLLRPHTRRMLVTPSATPSYGFSVRGGKEFSTGFFVSIVDRNSEAEQKGLRIGDQILRINGFRIDDATHKEFCQLVTSQDRLVLKVRSVGMMPTKDKENDCLSWSVVKASSISTTASECSYQSNLTERSASRHHNERVINIVLNVAPRTKLGLGICKGPEWKPGIFVQFTKEKSVAREAGLRPGDQILTVNSIDFSDVLFSEAVAVMKSSNKLDMTVHKSAGCDLFPGESSGYNSSASSVTGDQSPCWGDVKSKRLTAVREESTMAPPPPPPSSAGTTAASALTMSKHNIWNQAIYENEPRSRSKSNAEKCTKPSSSNQTAPPASGSKSNKEINKTIIKLSESGTSINNTFVANSHQAATDTIRRMSSPKEKLNHNQGTLTKPNQAGGNMSHNIPPPVPPPLAIPNPPTPQSSHNSSSSHSSNIEGPIKLGGMAATMQRYATLGNYVAINEISSPSANAEVARESTSANSQAIDNSSLSSAITEELKKRKAKRQPNSNCQSSQNSDGLNNNTSLPPLSAANEQKSTKGNGSLVGDQHSALMNEFKQAHKRMFKNGFKESEPLDSNDRQEALMRTTMMDDPTTYRAKGCKQNKFDATDNSKDPAEDTTDTHIPKPPPMQCASNNLMGKTHSQHKSPYDHNVQLRSSASSMNGHDNSESAAPIMRNLNRNSAAQVSPSSCNRQTLRLGTVTIGEYRNHNSRREPEKLDFIASQTKRNDSGDTTPTNETLQSELHNTLSRSKLKKTNSSHMEHQRNCPLNQPQQSQQQQQHSFQHNHHHQHHHHQHQSQQPQQAQQSQPRQHHQHHHHHNHIQSSQYDYSNVNLNNSSHSTYSVAEMSKKLQKTSINGGSAAGSASQATTASRSNNFSTNAGILKNGNRNSSSNSSSNKSTEKSIKFG